METLFWENGKLKLLDQTRLPAEVEYIECKNFQEVAEAIKSMKVRGAPAIGVAAAYGIALAAYEYKGNQSCKLIEEVLKAFSVLGQTRPTAVNLFWALDRMLAVAKKYREDVPGKIQSKLLEEALKIHKEDVETNKRLGAEGEKLVPERAAILTHCNAGSLATAGYGTALGVIRSAYRKGKVRRVYIDETRPLLQGARLTAWEMLKEEIPSTLIVDGMAAFIMQQEKVDMVVVGADRVAANGDVANKVGTYGLAVLARHHGRPFYVAAPLSTIDLNIKTGHEIPIEERDPDEVVAFMGTNIAPKGIGVYNPAFDLTPHMFINGIITEEGVVTPPFEEGLKRFKKT